MWTTDQMLWRTHRILCTDRGTALWTNSYAAIDDAFDLAFSDPPAVGEKNFSPELKITGNDLPPNSKTHGS
jgi:hypothetical protein